MKKLYVFDGEMMLFSPYRKALTWVEGVFVVILFISFAILAWSIIRKAKKIERHMDKMIEITGKAVKHDTTWVTITTFQPTIGQCDSTPYKTASLKDIPVVFQYEKWCAVSRDLLYWKLNFDDSIRIVSISGVDYGKYRVVDVMNMHRINAVDILWDKGNFKGPGYIIK